jgi:hypothetical protein
MNWLFHTMPNGWSVVVKLHPNPNLPEGELVYRSDTPVGGTTAKIVTGTYLHTGASINDFYTSVKGLTGESVTSVALSQKDFQIFVANSTTRALPPKCECGSDSVKSPRHSDWCPKR